MSVICLVPATANSTGLRSGRTQGTLGSEEGETVALHPTPLGRYAIIINKQGNADHDRAILSLQIPVKLLLGRLTSRAVLDAYDLQIYIPLLHAFRTGNLSRWRQLLEVPRTRDWLRRRNVWVMLYERGEILVWRNLFRRAYVLFILAAGCLVLIREGHDGGQSTLWCRCNRRRLAYRSGTSHLTATDVRSVA